MLSHSPHVRAKKRLFCVASSPPTQNNALCSTSSDISVGQHFLGGFSAEINTLHLLCAWSDILEYEVIPVTDYRYTKALKVI